MLAFDEYFPSIAGGTTGQLLLAQPGTLTGAASAASGVCLDFATNNLLKVRNTGNSADAGIQFSTATASGLFSTSSTISIQTGVAISSTATQAINMSSASSFGIFFGTGVPSITTATQGSVYLNGSGSSTSSRMYIFSSASTWIAVTTAS